MMRTLDGLQFADLGSSARLSLDGLYRYELVRRWNKGPLGCWVMLNPSTADASVDDPTIRKCIKFTRTWGLAGIVVVNLFAYRATDPKMLKAAADPVGPENDDAIHDAAVGSRVLIVAWGKHGSLYGRSEAVADILAAIPQTPLALAVNGDGSPKHPLYIKDNTLPVPWSPPHLSRTEAA